LKLKCLIPDVDVTKVVTDAKFYDSLFRGFRILIPPLFLFSLGHYYSASTTVLHCEGVETSCCVRVVSVKLVCLSLCVSCYVNVYCLWSWSLATLTAESCIQSLWDAVNCQMCRRW